MRKVLFLLTQICIILALLLFINGISWLVLHLRSEATFVDSNGWDNVPAFKNKEYAKELYDENQKVKSEYMSFTAWKQTTFKGKYIKTDENGERNGISSETENLNKSKPKVRLFGGSTMWGVGASDDSTITSFLQKIDNKYLVYNHGMQGFNSRQCLDRLITLYQLENKADIVIFYDGVNEMSMCAKTISLPGHYQEDLFKQKVANRNTILTPWDIIRQGIYEAFLNNTIVFTQKIHQKLFVTKKTEVCSEGYICKCDSVRTRKVAKILIESWKLSKSIVEKKGGRFIAILQPVFSEGKPNISYFDFQRNQYLIDYKDNYQSLYKEIRKQILENRYDWIYDFTGVLDDKNPHYIDFCHVNSSANAIIAQKIDSVINIKP